MNLTTIDPRDLSPVCADCQDTGRTILDVLVDVPTGEPITYTCQCVCVDPDASPRTRYMLAV